MARTVISECAGDRGSPLGGDGSTGVRDEGTSSKIVAGEGTGTAGMLGELNGIVETSLGVEIGGVGSGTDETTVGV